jgi:hypothetical protein
MNTKNSYVCGDFFVLQDVCVTFANIFFRHLGNYNKLPDADYFAGDLRVQRR